jgi:hypothetical protein
LNNLNDFTLLANAGFDPGWRVGYDTAWVVQLPPAPAGPWKRAFLGAKLGRAKLEPVPGRPSWEKRRVKGEIDVAVANEPLWPHSRRTLLTDVEAVPLEGDPDNAAADVGEARWFWTEVPLSHVSFDKPNFVALYSPSPSMMGPDRAPVLAAGPRPPLVPDVNTWLSSGRRGQPPLGITEALKTPINTYAPAVALKLVPENDRPPEAVWTDVPASGEVAAKPFLLGALVTGVDVSRAWVEFSTDTRIWKESGRALLAPPYVFTVKPETLPAGEVWLRIGAADLWESRAYTEPRRVIVPEKR